jgi:hypothetical protein
MHVVSALPTTDTTLFCFCNLTSYWKKVCIVMIREESPATFVGFKTATYACNSNRMYGVPVSGHRGTELLWEIAWSVVQKCFHNTSYICIYIHIPQFAVEIHCLS